MSSLVATLRSSAINLQVYDRALTVVQNNVTNANTAGYVKQAPALETQRFQPDLGDTGGVIFKGLTSSRDVFAERSVWDGQQSSGFARQAATQMSALEAAFPISDQSGIPKSISEFFASASQLEVNPNSRPLRQAFLNQADQVAQSFRATANSLSSQVATTNDRIRASVNTINELGRKIQSLNKHVQSGDSYAQDASLDAELHSTLEQLAESVNFTVMPQSDGTVTVFIAGQQALVNGSNVHPLSVQTAASSTGVLDADGNPITGELITGQLGALLKARNTTLPGAQNQLNQLAQGFADQVNTVLRGGLDQNGNPPVQDLFTYGGPAGIAATLSMNPLSSDQVAAASVGAAGGNGNIAQLGSLANAGTVQGQTFTSFYGTIAAQIGREKSKADDDKHTQASMLAQTQALRDQVSRVSLDEEAAHLVSLQSGYQAIAKMVTVLDDLIQSALGILR